MTSTINLNDKVALVTGASRGIGEAIALSFAQNGAKVVLASRKQEPLDAVAEKIRAAGGEALAVACHMGQEEAINSLIKQSVDTFGKVDILVNNAATNPYFGPMLDTEWAAWDKTFDVNVKGYFTAAKAVAQHLMEREAAGSIINVSSILGTMAGQFQGVYAMTKAAVISMTQTLALELGPNNIRVNAILPGIIKTKFSQALVSNEQITEMLMLRTPAGRLGNPEDIAGMAVFLASDASSYVTGSTQFVDGGMHSA